MQKSNIPFKSLAAALVLGAFVLPTVRCLAAEPMTPAATNAPAQVYTSSEISNVTTLAKAALKDLGLRKTPEMLAKLTELETAWDAQEKTLKPKDEASWTLIDKALDETLTPLRDTTTDAKKGVGGVSEKNLKKGKAALKDFIKKLGQATKTKAGSTGSTGNSMSSGSVTKGPDMATP